MTSGGLCMWARAIPEKSRGGDKQNLTINHKKFSHSPYNSYGSHACAQGSCDCWNSTTKKWSIYQTLFLLERVVWAWDCITCSTEVHTQYSRGVSNIGNIEMVLTEYNSRGSGASCTQVSQHVLLPHGYKQQDEVSRLLLCVYIPLHVLPHQSMVL